MIVRRWCTIAAAAALGVVASAVFATTAGAQTAAPNACAPGPVNAIFLANASRVGFVDLHFVRALGQPITFFECVGGKATKLGELASPEEQTNFYSATTWRCGRLVRRFAAIVNLPDGTMLRGVTDVRTRSCANRFGVTVPRAVAKGRRARVRIVDRWGIGGVRTKLCITSPRARRNCRTVVFRARNSAILHFRATTRGRWRVELTAPGTRVRDTVAVGVRPAASKRVLPTILATGDSTMQGIESFLGDDLGDEAKVVSDVRPGFAISYADEWQAIAKAQTIRLRPKTTVVSIGANEGWPMVIAGVKHECCGEPWIAEYARRVRASMQTYLRQGRSRVLWLTLPAPRDAIRIPIFAAVNTAILRASHGLAGLSVVRLDLLFSPSGWREFMPYQGRNVRVRARDGVHLSIAGTQIAEKAVLQALRAG
jgi:hypothetical protein